MKAICVFCGSGSGNNPEYLKIARNLGNTLAERGITLIYGGGNVGLMGEIARTVMNAGGAVIGVIPRHLAEKKVAYEGITDLRLVETMHERKAMMAELAEGFIALPGGLGTLEEIAEVLTWAQLGLHPKPCGLLNVSGYFDHLSAFLDHMVTEGFLHPVHRSMVQVSSDINQLLADFEVYHPPQADKAAWALKKNG